MDMQQYQQFWHDKLSHLDSQLLLDSDTFLTAFTTQIKSHTSITLTQLQKQIIKSQIDPNNQNQIYKNGFLLFIKYFWNDINNRNKLFNNKINLNTVKFNTNKIPMSGNITIAIKYPYQQQNNAQLTKQTKFQILDQYLIQNDKITFTSSTHPSHHHLQHLNKPMHLLNPGFISIGSSPQCQIQIPCNVINPHHFKLIYMTKLLQLGKSTYSFKIQPTPITSVYIRDTSTSNRLRYLLNSQHKYLALKTGMIISDIGLVSGMFQIVIDSTPNFQTQQINHVSLNLNADRNVVKVGQPWKPEKIVINYDLQPITQAMVRDLYDRNLYYPQPPKPSSAPKSLKPDRIPLTFRVINLRTLEQQKYDSKTNKILTIGRNSQKCQIIIDSISIRPIQFTFQMINDLWFLHRPQDTINTNINNSIGSIPGIYLTKNINKNSNRLPLNSIYPEFFGIKNHVQIIISVKDRNTQQF